MTTSTEHPAVAPPGLKGLVVADTSIGDVRGQEGFYHYRQYATPDLARSRSFEDVWHLLLDGTLPDERGRLEFLAETAPHRALPPALVEVLPQIAATASSPATALRTALSHHASVLGIPSALDSTPAQLRAQALALSAATPAIVAALHRVSAGRAVVPSRPDLDAAADYLHMLHGAEPDPALARALEQYLILALDHGFNASTFTARIVASTGSDLGSALVAGLGALLGPLHGGAPSRALDTLEEIGSAERARDWVRAKVRSGERIMGFGHPVYRTDDPRSVLLREVACSLGGRRVDLAVAVEREVEAALAELKPDRVLKTNIEWYAAVVMDRVGLPRELFTPTFAVSRVVGWSAHALEQIDQRTLIRPSSHYVGPEPPVPVPRP